MDKSSVMVLIYLLKSLLVKAESLDSISELSNVYIAYTQREEIIEYTYRVEIKRINRRSKIKLTD